MTWWPDLIAAAPAEGRATWPSYLVAIGLTIGVLAIIAFNIRSRRRARQLREGPRRDWPQE